MECGGREWVAILNGSGEALLKRLMFEQSFEGVVVRHLLLIKIN